MGFPVSTSSYLKKDLQAEAELLYQEMSGNPERIQVEIDGQTEVAAALCDQKKLHIHPLLCISPEDLPSQLRVSGPDDPVLKTGLYFAQLKKWLAIKFDLPEKNLHGLEKIFTAYLHIWEDPKMCDRVRKFTIAHEMAHIYHQHSTWDDQVLALIISYFITCLVCIVEITLDPFALFITLFVVSSIVFEQIYLYISRQQEHEADLTAFKVTKDWKAAETLFTAFHLLRRERWNKLWLIEKIFHTISSHKTHPLPEERMQYLQRMGTKLALV